MAKKKQHFVPQVYMKAWQTSVEMKSTSGKLLPGVYHFEGEAMIGEGVNRKSVLWMPHLYTVRFAEHMFISKSCSKIKADFVEQIHSILNARDGGQKGYAKCGRHIVKSKKDIDKYFYDIDDWKFFYVAGGSAGSSYRNAIDNINSYIIENGFDELFESEWEVVRDQFIAEVQKGIIVSRQDGTVLISKESAEKMLRMFFMMLCRNPNFLATGVYRNIKESLLDPIYRDCAKVWVKDSEEELSEEKIREAEELANKESKNMMTAIWYSELYRMMFKNSGGFYHRVMSAALDGCQMMLFETYNGAEHFITSDNPAFEYRNNVTANNENAYVFPITPHCLLYICKGSNPINVIPYRRADTKTVKHFNRMIANNKTEKIIADKKDLRQLL